MFAKVSMAKLSVPTTVKLFNSIPKLGKELIRLKSNSLKSTFAFSLSLMDDLTLATISFLKTNGIIAAAAKKTTKTIPVSYTHLDVYKRQVCTSFTI